MLKRLWKVTKIVLAGVLVLVVLGAAAAAFWVHAQMQRPDIWAERARWPKAMTFEAADRAALDLVSRMTLDEKVEQMTGSGMAPMILPMFLRGEAAPVYSGANGRLGIPPVSFTDGPRGVISGRSTSFPVAIARAATWDVNLQRRVGDVIGQEARAQGANYWGGLCLTVVRHPSMGRAEETYGEDPWLTGEMGAAILEAVQRHNVMACAKHYALNSMETARFKINVEIDERTLREVYLPQFRKAVEHDVASFMSAYNKVRGEWCGENRHLLTTILREDWGFRGFVTSDWGWGLYDGKRGAHAGLDIEMPSGQFYGKNLKALVQRGEVPEAEVDEAVRRIVRTKLLYLTREDPQEYPRSLAGSPAHAALARVLFGDVNPSGKMPLTTPKTESQLPFFDEFADSIEYGPYHGYTLFDKKGEESACPFGYGLSYTSYVYSNLRVATPSVAPDGTVDVTVDVTNTGARAGSEVAQLYVGFDGSPVERPVRLLRGFKKVALDPGETRTVSFSVAVKDLAWYDAANRAWKVDSMKYGIFVGPSSRGADLLVASVTVTAASAP